MRLEDGSKGWKEWNLKIKCAVKFMWTPGHEGIEGNKRADEAAKEAESGESSDPKKLPAFQRHTPLPVSVSATRQVLKKEMKNRWKTEWKTSLRYTKTKGINNSLPSDDYLHIIYQLQCNQASLPTQLRTGHIPLNTVLHHIKHPNTPNCPHWKNGIHKTIHHFLIVCPHYNIAR